MSLKMKFIGIALVVSASSSNAQSYDYKKELAENPEGAKAAFCIGVLGTLAADVGRDDPRYKVYQHAALAPTFAASKAYTNPTDFSEKTLAAGAYFAHALGRAKGFSLEAYQTQLKILKDAANICKRDYPEEIKLEAK